LGEAAGGNSQEYKDGEESHKNGKIGDLEGIRYGMISVSKEVVPNLSFYGENVGARYIKNI
jgi:hypothetical protein